MATPTLTHRRPTTAPANPAAPVVPAREVAKTSTGRLVLFASLVISFLAASSAPTPLYEHYVAVWHGTALTGTAAFGIYAIAVLVGLLTLGNLALHVGRRPVLLAALGGQAAAMVLFATAGSFTPLFAGRVVQGLAAGAALGTLGAAMIEAHQSRGTVGSAAAPTAGTGLGALVAGLIVAYLPWPTHLVYVILLAVFVLQAVAVAAVPDTSERRPGALAALRPHAALPSAARGAFVTAVPVLLAVWALAGFYGSLGPSLSRQLAGSGSVALGGVGLFVLAWVSSIGTILLRNWAGRAVMILGVVTLILGVGGTVVAIQAGSITGYFIATAVTGVGFGGGFQGGIRTVVPLAQPAERAGVLSALFVISYLGMGVPAVIAGFVVSRGLSLTTASSGYAAALVILALIAGVRLIRHP